MTQPPQAPLPRYGPAPLPFPPRPPRQPTTLWRPLIWTLCLSAVGAIAIIAALIALVIAIVLMFLLLVAAIVDSFTVDEIFSEGWVSSLGGLFTGWGPEFSPVGDRSLPSSSASRW